MSDAPLSNDRVVFVQVCLKSQKPWERTWITVKASSLDEGCTVAEEMDEVAAIHEACWDPGYIT